MMEKKTEKCAVNFIYEDTPGKSVMVAGSFNDWQPEKELKDKDGSGIYRGRILLPEGEYQYKLVVDGEWKLDPANPNFCPNSYGSLNSLLNVKKRKVKK